MPVRLALGALLLAVLGGIAAVMDGNWAIAPYYAIAAPLIGVAALGLTGAAGLVGVVAARLVAAALVAVNGGFAVLLAMERVACGCSSPTPVALTPFDLVVTFLHMAGAFGAAALLAIGTILQYRASRRVSQAGR